MIERDKQSVGVVVLVFLCERELLYVIVSMFVRERVHLNTSNKRGSHDSSLIIVT